MMNALKNKEMEFPLNHITVETDIISTKNLEYFVSNNKLKFFNILGISFAFLNKYVEI